MPGARAFRGSRQTRPPNITQRQTRFNKVLSCGRKNSQAPIFCGSSCIQITSCSCGYPATTRCNSSNGAGYNCSTRTRATSWDLWPRSVLIKSTYTLPLHKMSRVIPSRFSATVASSNTGCQFTLSQVTQRRHRLGMTKQTFGRHHNQRQGIIG